MKRKITLPIIGGLAIIALSASTVLNNSGVSNWTGSPVDGGPGSAGQCSACHSGGSSIPTLSVTSSPAFGGTGNAKTYMANMTYTITITPSGSYAGYGFNCEILNSQSATLSAVGSFGTWGTAVSTNCQIYPTASGWPACASHKTRSTSAFSFKWTAPASGTGYLYADVLGANGDGGTGGDKVSGVTSVTLTAASSMGIATHDESAYELNVFPNPATDNVRITYSLSERSHVAIKLCAINGEVVADLFNEDQDRGSQTVAARLPIGLAKGMYMVKLNINGKQALQKIMIL